MTLLDDLCSAMADDVVAMLAGGPGVPGGFDLPED
jgi:hypothetical protein